MRRFSSRPVVALLSLAAAWSAASHAQSGGWIQTNPPPHPADNRTEFLSLSVLPSQTVLVGVSGVIFQTTDDGVTWTRPDSGTRQALNGVSFAAQAGTAVGEGGTILRSDDGGLSWAAQFSGTTASLGGVSVVDANTAIAVGEAGTILRTDDGGITWTPQESGTTLTLFGVSFANPDNGTAVGEAGTILSTDDGGTTWTVQDSGTTSPLYSVSLAGAASATAVGGDGVILRTDDGGQTWMLQFSGTLNPLVSVTFVNASTGWVVVENVSLILRTIDGGEHWTLQLIERGAEAVSFADPNTGTVVGRFGFLARSTDGGVTWRDYPPAPPPPNDAVVDACLLDANGWAVTDALDGILRTTDGGAHWTHQRTGWFNATFRRIACVDSQIAIAVGGDGSGIIVRTTDGGEHWTRQGIGAIGGVLTGVSFWGPDVGTVTGDADKILHTDDGGATWTPLRSPSGGPFDDVYQGDPTIIVTATANYLARRSDNGGATWISTQFNGFCFLPHFCYLLNRISFVSAEEWWGVSHCCGGGPPRPGAVHHTIDGGANWSIHYGTPGFVALNAVSFPNSATGIAVGNVGVVIRTTDGGANWRPQSTGTRDNLMAVSFVDANIGIVGGGNELILRTTTGGE